MVFKFAIIIKKRFSKRTGFVFSNKNFIVTFHPETLSADFGISGLENLLKCLKDKNCNVLFTAPNADTGSDLVLKIIKDFINLNKIIINIYSSRLLDKNYI